MRGLAQTETPVVIAADPRSGFPVISIGRQVTSDEVAEILDDE